MFRHYTLTLTGSAQPLSDVLPTTDQEPFQRQISLQPDGANNNPTFVGGSGVTTSDFGVRLPAGDANDEPPAQYSPSDMFGPTGGKLSEIFVIGTNTETLHVFVNSY